MTQDHTTGGSELREHLFDLLSSIQNAQLALQRWDAAAFEREVTEQQRICELLKQTEPATDYCEEAVLASQVRATLSSYGLLIERGTRWCQTLGRIIGEPATPQSLNLRSEL